MEKNPNAMSAGGRMLERRGFLKKAITGILALLSGLSFLSLCSLYPGRIRRKTVHYIPVLAMDEAPRAGVKTVMVPFAVGGRILERRAFLVATEEGLMALSSQCTHLGCSVVWDSNAREFTCPCHGGRYDSLGRPIAGPPPSPLETLPVRVEGGSIHLGVPMIEEGPA